MSKSQEMDSKISSVCPRRRLRLGVLAYGWPFGRREPAKMLRDMIGFAQALESMGYDRIWLTEHHAPGIAWASPIPLLAAIGQATSRIRVGTAGVLLPAYNPLEIAMHFKCAAALYPGRVDLGLASSPAGVNHSALGGDDPESREKYQKAFQDKVETILKLLDGRKIRSGAFKGCQAFPEGQDVPEVWLLGGGGKSMELASRLGLNYSHGLFFRPNGDSAEDIARYREAAAGGAAAQGRNIVVSVVCAATERAAKARYREACASLLGPLKLPQDLPAIVGTPEQCVRAFQRLGSTYQAREIVIRSLLLDPKERLRQFQSLIEACHGAAPARDAA